MTGGKPTTDDKRETLMEALRDINTAAYVAIRAGKDTTLFPHLDRQTLRQICTMTDKLVDDGLGE